MTPPFYHVAARLRSIGGMGRASAKAGLPDSGSALHVDKTCVFLLPTLKSSISLKSLVGFYISPVLWLHEGLFEAVGFSKMYQPKGQGCLGRGRGLGATSIGRRWSLPGKTALSGLGLKRRHYPKSKVGPMFPQYGLQIQNPLEPFPHQYRLPQQWSPILQTRSKFLSENGETAGLS